MFMDKYSHTNTPSLLHPHRYSCTFTIHIERMNK
ncbi:mCG1032846 [Mus musculus]|nr:mCG1032846 [Mus musculus]